MHINESTFAQKHDSISRAAGVGSKRLSRVPASAVLMVRLTPTLTGAGSIQFSVAGPAGRAKSALRDTVAIEDLNVRPPVKKAIILLLHRGFVKVLKDALAHLGPYPTLTKPRCSDPGGENTVLLSATIQI